MERVISPAIEAIKNAGAKGSIRQSKKFHSSWVAKMKVVTDLPKNVFMRTDGVDARFSIINMQDQLIVEGLVLLPLPLLRDFTKSCRKNLTP